MRSYALGVLGLWLWLGFAVAGPSLAVDGSKDDPLAGCHQQVAERPESYESYLCFFLSARQVPRSEDPERWQRVEETLTSLQGPDVHWPTLILGYAAMGHDDEVALRHLEAAAEAFHRQGEVFGEVMARTNARKIHLGRENLDQAGEHVRLARLHAESSDDVNALARALVLSAGHRLDTGGDLGQAYAELQRASRMDVPGSSGERLQARILFNLGRLASDLGQWDDAITIHRQHLESLEKQGTTRGRAVSALNLALAYQALAERRPTPDAMAQLEHYTRQALVLAQEQGNATITAQVHRVLAEGLMASQPAQAKEHLDTCRKLAQEAQATHVESSCEAIASRLLLKDDPGAALEVGQRAVDLARRSQRPLFEAHAWRSVMRAAWQAEDRGTAVAVSEEALRSIETLRSAQKEALSRAQLLSFWSSELAWLTGRWLEEETPDLDQAFGAIERQRSRVLLEAMSRSGLSKDTADVQIETRRRIAALQRRLMDPALGEVERLALLSELERWELEERFQVTDLPSEVPASITRQQLQDALRPDEALLSFQVDAWTDLYGQAAGGAWVLVTTAQGSRHYAIDDPLALEPAVSVFLGLLERRDGSEAPVAEALYDVLLRQVLADLPESTQRLILVADGVLHHLPWAVLGAQESPLGARYEIVLAPSATLWHRWRHATPPPPSRSLLALADPRLPATSHTPRAEGDEAVTRNAVLVDGLRLPQLPNARREGRRILRHLGGELAVGAEASEHFLKGQDLQRYGVLHFASHAVADMDRPERSSLVLSAGSLDEDGLLRSPEIADLDLNGRLVVLSACQTHAGELLRAEGILSLARAFFEAGAHGVVGSRWPLRDDDAAQFFDVFYHHLADGESAAGALQSARRDAIAMGLPAATWAGVSLLGSGDLGVTPEARSSALAGWWMVALALALGAVYWRWRRELGPRR